MCELIYGRWNSSIPVSSIFSDAKYSVNGSPTDYYSTSYYRLKKCLFFRVALPVIFWCQAIEGGVCLG